MDIKEILEKLNIEPVELNVSEEYDTLLQYYKSLAIKYVLTAEKSLYNMSSQQNLLKNCTNDNCYIVISDFIHGIFTFNITYAIDKNSKELIENIIKLNKEDKISILKKIFKIIDAFYSIIQRGELSTESLNHYIKDIVQQFNDYVQTYLKEIIELIKDNRPMDEEMNFKLSNINYL